MGPQLIILNEKSDQQTPLPSHTNPEPTPTIPDRSKCRRRKLRFLAAIFFVWLGFKVYTNYFRFCTGRHVLSAVWSTPENMVSPIPPDITLEECAGWEGDGSLKGRYLPRDQRFTSYASFKLPITSDKLFMLARGMAAGSVNVRYGSGSDDVKVTVKANYRFQEAIDGVKVCTVKRGDDEHGLGIFGPEWSRHNAVRFDTTFYLPEAEKGSVLYVNSFETDVPLFTHFIGDLQSSVYFDAFKLKSEHTPIFVKSLGAGDAILSTRNSPITGTFNVSSSLELRTANARIDATVNLFNEGKGATTDVDMKTSNARIIGNLKLESSKTTGGKYRVSASTSNSPLDLVFSDAPVRSTLVLDASTSLGRAYVQLNETYEGTFDLATSLMHPQLTWKGGVEDPEGRGRRRKVEVINSGTKVSGNVRWSENGEEMPGEVRIKTSLAPLTLSM